MRYTGAQRAASTGSASQARCVFHKDSLIRTTDVPPSETTRWRAVVRVLRSPLDSLSCALLPRLLRSLRLALCRGFPPCQFAMSAGRSFPSRAAPSCPRCGDALDRPVGPGSSQRFAALAAWRRRRLSAPFPMAFTRAACARPFTRSSTTACIRLPPGWAGCWPRRSRNWPARLRRRCWSFRCRCIARNTRSADSTSRVRWPPRRWVSCARAIRSGGSRWRRARCMRLRATESQAGLTPRQRRLNVRGAFSVSDPSR